MAADGDILAPLIYSTELSRSVALGYAASARVDLDRDPQTPPDKAAPEDTKLEARSWRPRFRTLSRTPVATNLVYGLVNVRTDGEHILCGTMKETGKDFDVKVFKAGVEVPAP